MSGKIVRLVDPSIFVAEEARNLFWNHKIRLKGADGIHVATAIGEGCCEFITTDEKITKQGKKFSTSIANISGLGLSIIRASQTSILPEEYRQDSLSFESKKPN